MKGTFLENGKPCKISTPSKKPETIQYNDKSMKIEFDLTISERTITFNGSADLFRGRIEGTWKLNPATTDVDG